MARGIGLRHEPAERHAEHDRRTDLERFAELPDVVSPLLELETTRIPSIAAPVPAVVDIDHLRDVRECAEPGTKQRVIESGAAVQREKCRPLGERRPAGFELASLDIEEEMNVVDANPHAVWNRM